jgi:pimeloyl-ACP methyl ester carboxylesterase
MPESAKSRTRQPNTQIHQVSQARESSVGDIVFIHGLDGDPFLTWGREDGDGSWLNWLATDFPQLTVYTVDYAAWSSRWRGTAMPIQDRAINLIAALESAGVGSKPLIFVCHSMGGLLAKQIAFQCLALSEQSSRLGESIHGIAFLATPHSGSSLSKVADALRVVYRPTAAVQDLEDNDSYLRMLNRWYRASAPSHGIESLALCETISIKGILVVDATSADPGIAGIEPIPTDCNHINICKPSSRTDFVYRQVHGFIGRLLSRLESPASTNRTKETTAYSRATDHAPESTLFLPELAEQLQASGILDEARSWLLRDQILESGGWGLSQATLFQRLTGRSVTDVERREGGIISTYVSLRALRAYEAAVDIFRSRPYAWKAARYLMERQTTDGGFGRYVESRSGEEIHATVRHTAFAISALIDLDPGSTALDDGIAYLRRRLEAPRDGWWSDEAAPSLALAGVLHVDERLTAVEEDDEIDSDISDPLLSNEQRREIRGHLSRLSSYGPHAPFWIPYAKTSAMVFDTALTTIELLPHPVEKSLRVPVARVLKEIASHAIDGGIPYGPRENTPDIGMSALALFILTSRITGDDKMASILARWNLTTHIPRLAEFIMDNWTVEAAWRLTYSDTLAYLLRIPRHLELA